MRDAPHQTLCLRRFRLRNRQVFETSRNSKLYDMAYLFNLSFMIFLLQEWYILDIMYTYVTTVLV
ncbi:hypothetical protein GIB67_018890 [Kingdonia uniflora]|uniref:Uncharacterized protein n=1 Tax=Kingdonia uniflora TaxID=39325 RepID=A0A7J7MZA7_9MAGN|nr:hypothetical protein GIB67_018890 [Kingdonia uniflora]